LVVSSGYGRLDSPLSTRSVDERPDSTLRKMSENTLDSDSDPDHDLDGADEYEQMLEQLDVAISEVNSKIENGRVRSPEHDQVRIKQKSSACLKR
jgi:hypothetical protein